MDVQFLLVVFSISSKVDNPIESFNNFTSNFLLKVSEVSQETNQIVNTLPKLEID